MNDLKQGEENKMLLTLVWLIPFFAPIAILGFSFLFQKWHWGLMDDMTILRSGAGIYDRLINYFHELWAWGVFRPTYILHSAVFYTLFEHHPNLFYFFRLIEVSFVVLLWGVITSKITHSSVSIFLFGSIVLSFHYFYDQLFYLSSQEILGLLFIGISVIFFLKDLDLNKTRVDWRMFLLGIIFFFLGLGSKETFITSGAAIVLIYFLSIFIPPKSKKTQIAKVCFFSFLLILYVLFIKTQIQSGYTSDYNIFNFDKIRISFIDWFKKDLLNHSPWIVITLASLLWIKNKALPLTGKEKVGIFLGLMFYLGFLAVLLPWNTISYYASPLGVFFAFFVTLMLTKKIEGMPLVGNILLVICALLLNIFVSAYALNREAVYQRDTGNLVKWFVGNKENLQKEGSGFMTNAMEAGGSALPAILKKEYGMSIASKWKLNLAGFFQDNSMKYYLYSPRFNKIDLSSLKRFEIVFLSNNWIIYKKL